ncbi:MAG: alpha/beta hydrolase [Dorea sp.]
MENGCICHSDISYGSKYPNGFLDIYVQPDAKEKNHATFFYVHGGGFTWGTKEDGDPNAKGAEKDWFLRSFLDAGMNAVAIDYAYAPDYMYPTPILQMGEAFEFLKTAADEYGLDMHKIVLCGGSAGGQLIGQFANIQTNESYAKEMNVAPTLAKEDMKAMLFNSALLECERFGETGNFLINYLFNKCGSAYFHCKKPKGHPLVIQSDVLRNVTENFPPSFISDGNTASFPDQAMKLANKLEKLGVDHQLNLYPKEEKVLSHGFESFQDEYGKDNMKKMLAYLRKLEVIS